jgi:DNA-binding CsgD family transcriptional regulator
MTVSARHLVAREEELAALLDLLDAPDESFAAAVVAGEAGIGKTTLSSAAAKAAEARGHRVLTCRASEAEARFSFVGLSDLISDAVVDLLPKLPRPQRRALETALALSDSDAAPADESVVAFAFLTSLQTLAANNRLLLVIDDVQWLDAPSLAILRFALSRLEKEPVTAILTARGEVPPWVRRGVLDERLVIIELGPLSIGALHELLRARIGAVLPRPTLLRIWETSGGNPFFALELANALVRRGGRVEPGEELPISADLQELVHERLDRLTAPEMEVARVVAALATPTLRLVEEAVGPRSQTGLAGALEAGILALDGERVLFTHPLLGSAVSSRSTPGEQRSLHAQLASLVVGQEERARHLALAAPEPSGEVAAVVEQAAESVHARGAPAAAAELTELALRLTPPDDVDDLFRRMLDCADRHRDAGDGRRAITLLEQARETAPPGLARAAVLVRLATTVSLVDGPREAVDLYREALADAEGDAALRAQIHLRLADDVSETEDRERGLAHAELAVQAASRADDSTLRCEALASFALLHFGVGRGIPRERMDEALALERSLLQWPQAGVAALAHAFQLVWSGELDRARSILEASCATLNARDDLREADALWLLSILEWRAGNWDLAASRAADTLALREQFGRAGLQPIAEMPSAMIAAHRGHVDEARDRSERALSLAQTGGVRIALSGHRCVLGFIELSCGDPAAALVYLEPAWEIRDSVRLLEPGHRLELADTLEAMIAVGRLEDAEAKLSVWEERSRTLDRSWALAITARCRGLLLAAQGDVAGAEASLERALVQHARTQDPFQHARTLLAFGATQRRAKHRSAARGTLDQALAMFEGLGAPLWAEQARAELRRIGGRTPSGRELTEAEQRIAALVAEGRTNREVAAALFVTEHTVEAALTRAYRKLGVRSRAELAHRLRHET